MSMLVLDGDLATAADFWLVRRITRRPEPFFGVATRGAEGSEGKSSTGSFLIGGAVGLEGG